MNNVYRIDMQKYPSGSWKATLMLGLVCLGTYTMPTEEEAKKAAQAAADRDYDKQVHKYTYHYEAKIL